MTKNFCALTKNLETEGSIGEPYIERGFHDL